MTKIKYEDDWSKFIARADNFHWNSQQVKCQMAYFETIYKKVQDSLLRLNDIFCKETLLETLFAEIYTATTMSDLHFTYFIKGGPLYNNVYKVCFFTSLCMFLHESTRLSAKPLRQFIYDHSPEQYNERTSNNFCPPDHPSDNLLNDTTLLRKQRHRILSSRPVYNKRKEWSAMAVDSEYEWSYKYVIENRTDTLYDTYKRMGNLYKDINDVLNLEPNSDSKENLKKAYKKFLSKLAKIKYENYLELQKDVLDYSSKNDKYYGINLYRIEKRLRPYLTTQEVNQMLACETIADEEDILAKSAILKEICFPKVYNDLATLAYISDIEKWSARFHILHSFIIPISCLFFDESVDNKGLGEDWEAFLCKKINELAKEVLYTPKDIDYTVTPKSQEKYMRLLSVAVEKEIYDRTKIIIS